MVIFVANVSLFTNCNRASEFSQLITNHQHGSAARSLVVDQVQQNVFHFYRAETGENFLTLNYLEGINAGFQYVGIAFNTLKTGSNTVDTLQIFRCITPSAYHFVSADPACEGQARDGEYGHIYASPRPGGHALYRGFNIASGDHLTSLDRLVTSTNGYQFEGIQGYAPELMAEPRESDATIQKTVLGSPLSIRSSRAAAGAIVSLNWKGKEFINLEDHGRQIQSAVVYDGFGECLNPTEAGSGRDGVFGSSTSELQSMTADDGILRTTARMAYWGWPKPQNAIFGCNGADKPVNTTELSDTSVSKEITIGFHGFENVIHYKTTFHVPAAHSNTNFTLTAYLPPDIRAEESLDIEHFQLVHYKGQYTADPIIAATTSDSGDYALALYSPFHSRSERANWAANKDGNTTILQLNYNFASVEPGDYAFDQYVIVGTKNEVAATIYELDKLFDPAEIANKRRSLSAQQVSVSRYVNPINHFHASNLSPGGLRPLYAIEGPLMVGLQGPSAGLHPLYSCVVNQSGDTFTSPDIACEGNSRIGLSGFFGDQPTSQTSKPIFRCAHPTYGHMDSLSQDECASAGYTIEGVLGYAI